MNYGKYDKHRKIFMFTLFLYIVTIIIGTILYMILFDLEWLDALYSSILILTAISNEYEAITSAQKVFIIIYSIISVVILLSFANSASKYLLDYLND